MEPKFYVGQKVVCIDAPDPINSGVSLSSVYWKLNNFPLEGMVYTIRSLHMDDGVVFIRLKEIINPRLHYSNNPNGETSWDSDYFRPLSEKTVESEAFAETLIKELQTEIIETYTIR